MKRLFLAWRFGLNVVFKRPFTIAAVDRQANSMVHFPLACTIDKGKKYQQTCPDEGEQSQAICRQSTRVRSWGTCYGGLVIETLVEHFHSLNPKACIPLDSP